MTGGGVIKFFRQAKAFLPLLLPAAFLLLIAGAGEFYHSTAAVPAEYIHAQCRTGVPPLAEPEPGEVPHHALGRRIPGTLPLLLREGRHEGSVPPFRGESVEFKCPYLYFLPEFIPGKYFASSGDIAFLSFRQRALPVRAGPVFA
ncbi:MAG: hypothetical protein IKC89_02820 [Lentisphaeria bacterium]|nr:hypothetical protein [Lentisphaeria bacterium]